MCGYGCGRYTLRPPITALPFLIHLKHTYTHTLTHALSFFAIHPPTTGFNVKDAMEQARVVGREGVVLQEKFRYAFLCVCMCVLVCVCVHLVVVGCVCLC